MKLAKEPKEVDFTIKSEPWSDAETADFRKLIQKIKRKNKRISTTARKTKTREIEKGL